MRCGRLVLVFAVSACLCSCSRGGSAPGSAEKCQEALSRLAMQTRDERLAEMLKSLLKGGGARGDAPAETSYCEGVVNQYAALENCSSPECREKAHLYEAILAGDLQAAERGVREQFGLLLSFQQTQRDRQRANAERLRSESLPAACSEPAPPADAPITDLAAKRVASRFLELVMTYSTENARARFLEAQSMVSDTYRPAFEQNILGGELGIIQNGKRSQDFRISDEDGAVRSEGSCRAFFMTGTEQRRMAGGALPRRQKLLRVVVRTVADPAAGGQRAAIESLDAELLSGR